jgi:hypothetical protein
MPLNTEIIRDGKPLTLEWGGFHVVAMVCAAAWDSGKGPFEDNTEPPVQTEVVDDKTYTGHFIAPSDVWKVMSYGTLAMTPLNDGSYKLKHSYTFVDCQDLEVFILQPGDVLHAYRSYKS